MMAVKPSAREEREPRKPGAETTAPNLNPFRALAKIFFRIDRTTETPSSGVRPIRKFAHA
jgi:hypothetical protein